MLGETSLEDKLRREARPPNGMSVASDAGRWTHGSYCTSSHKTDPSNYCPICVAKGLFAVLSVRLKALAGGDGQHRLVWVPSSGCLERLWSWTTWIVSVLFFSYMFSYLGLPNNHGLIHEDVSAVTTIGLDVTTDPAVGPGYLDAKPGIDVHHFSKRSTCAVGGVDKDKYNTGLHAAALFIIWFVSTLGCAFPIMAAKFPGLRIPRRFFFTVRHFGTGVLIATAFVHLLPTAFVSLGNPCLGDFWTEKYNAMPGAIALAAIFLVAIIEMVFHPSRHVPPADIVARTRKQEKQATDADGQPIRDMGPLRGRASSLGKGLAQLNQPNLGSNISSQGQLEGCAVVDKTVSTDGEEEVVVDSDEQPTLSSEQKRRKERLQCILLEMGILFHSVFIGMALSVSIGNDFIVLLIAIIFHRSYLHRKPIHEQVC